MAAITGTVIAGAAVANSVYQGNKAADAAKDAAKIQAASAEDAAAGVDERFNMMRTDLSSYRQAGETALPMLSEFATNPQSQVDYLNSNPLFQNSLDIADRNTAALLASQGKIGTGDQSLQLQQNYLSAASPLLSAQDQRLTNLASIGQSSAAMTGNAGIDAANASGNYLTQGASATASGIVGANNAQAQGVSDALSGISSIAGMWG